MEERVLQAILLLLLGMTQYAFSSMFAFELHLGR